MDFTQYIDIIRTRLSGKRFVHSMAVADSCRALAAQNGADPDKAYLAGIMHDIAKELDPIYILQMLDEFGIILDSVQKQTKKLLHGIMGEQLLKREFGITDSEILSAVRYHTTARPDMCMLEKVLYLADFISADRDYEGVGQIREAALSGLDSGVYAGLKFTVCNLVEEDKQIHPDTTGAYNQMCGIMKNSRQA